MAKQYTEHSTQFNTLKLALEEFVYNCNNARANTIDLNMFILLIYINAAFLDNAFTKNNLSNLLCHMKKGGLNTYYCAILPLLIIFLNQRPHFGVTVTIGHKGPTGIS